MTPFLHYPLSRREPARLKMLRKLDILDTAPEHDYDAIVQVARQLFGVKICQISLIDEHRQWIKASAGSDIRETDRVDAFCNHTIMSGEVLIIKDARTDPRFAANPFVVGEPNIRFYAGAPLDMGNGLYAGSLCLIDTSPRALDPDEQLALERLAALVSRLLRLRRQAKHNQEMVQALHQGNAQIAAQAVSLEKSKKLLDAASKVGKLGAWEIDCKTNQLTWSDGMYALYDMEPGTVVTVADLPKFYRPETFRRLKKIIRRSIANNEPYTFEGEMLTAAGTSRWVRITCDIDTQYGVAVRRFGIQQDITEERQSIDNISRLANTDTLTSLHNRVSLLRTLDLLTQEREPFELILLDLDGFKDINDVYGHSAGDYCLTVVADRLSALCGPKHFLARLGGDEFAIIVERRRSPTATPLAKTILQAVGTTIDWNGASLQFSTSIGITSVSPDEQASATEVLRQADLALYNSKAVGRNCMSFYSIELLQASEQRALTVLAVRIALEAGGLELFYQAKVPLKPSHKTCFEALLRWRQCDGKVMGPDSFRAALDDPKLSLQIGDFVIREALDQAVRWRSEGYEFGSIAINIGAGQFRDAALGDRLIAAIRARRLDPSCIQVEVTEDVLLSGSVETVIGVCRQLRAYGVGVAFDDFGTGFASLTHLLEFPITEIKIDRSFVGKLFVQKGTQLLIKSIAELGQGLGMDVVAEGVETAEQLEFVKSIGCSHAQGYYFHRPAPAKEINNGDNPWTMKLSRSQLTNSRNKSHAA